MGVRGGVSDDLRRWRRANHRSISCLTASRIEGGQCGCRSDFADQYDGVIFDMDGVITDTASVGAVAWRRMFDEFLAGRAARPDEDCRSFTPDDYREYVDGKPRYDGVSALGRARDPGRS